MSGFKDMVASDISAVFLNTDEFAELRTVIYDGETYDGPEHKGIPVVLKGIKEEDRPQMVDDHAQGLYLVSLVLDCAITDLGGNQPEKGCQIQINDEEGGGGFFRTFRVASSDCEMGMLHVELEAIDE